MCIWLRNSRDIAKRLKAEGFERGAPIKSDALTAEQKLILEQRGYLSPEEIHKLASKTKKVVGAEEGKAACHSDYVDPEEAKKMQGEVVVQLNTAPAHGIASEDRII